MSWKILVSDAIDEKGVALLKEKADIEYTPNIEAAELVQKISEFDALVVRGRTKVTNEIIEAGKKLKVIGRAGVGVDNIDLNSAKKNSVTVINAPTATTNAVAELTLGAMLSLVRHIPTANSSMKKGEWNKKAFKGLELKNKTLGLIGIGRIGSRVAELSKAFGMEIIGYDPFLSSEEIKASHADPHDLESLYKNADFISLHLPLNDDTRNMINDDSLSKMKKGSYLLCMARGGIINEKALLEQLNNGHLAGAALDVFSEEPPGLTDLVAHPNVITTPHLGAQTEESQVNAAIDIAEEIIKALENMPLRWQVV